MIPSPQKHHVTTGGAIATGQFGISKKSASFVMKILRSQIYTDKPLAVLREYSANAWDANRANGRDTVPIRVHLPTKDDPWLRITDDGPGLSREDVLTVYTQYGDSTKRGSNDAVGMLGIGSKSAFSYTNKFHIVSCHGGVRSTYIAALDETDAGCINLMHEEPCGDTTGIEIQIAIEEKDFETFRYKAQQLFVHFNPRPQINTQLPAVPEGTIYPTGIIRPAVDEMATWVAVMGCVPYRIDLNQLQNLPRCIQRLSGILKFNIGEVEMSASREELDYSDQTKTAVAAKIDELLTSFIKDESRKIEDAQTSLWEKRLRVQTLTNQLFLPLHLGSAYKNFGAGRVELEPKDNPFQHFTLKHCDGKETRRQISVSRDVRFVIYDDKRSIKGYRLSYETVLVHPNTRATKIVDVQAELENVLAKYQLTGVKVELASKLPWVPSRRAPSARTPAERKKHMSTSFVFVHRSAHTIPLSESWAVTKRRPLKSDVYVILSNFKTDDTENYDVYDRVQRLKKLATVANVRMPNIYGYKRTQANPVEHKDIVGRRLAEWEPEFIKKLATKHMIAMHDSLCWSKIAYEFGIDGRWRTDNRTVAQRCDEIVAHLGPKHPISQFITKCAEGAKLAHANSHLRYSVEELAELNKLPNRAAAEYEKACARYPLVRTQDEGFGVLWKVAAHVKPWLEYVEAMDRTRRRKQKETP